jgi:hypothetical protein
MHVKLYHGNKIEPGGPVFLINAFLIKGDYLAVSEYLKTSHYSKGGAVHRVSPPIPEINSAETNPGYAVTENHPAFPGAFKNFTFRQPTLFRRFGIMDTTPSTGEKTFIASRPPKQHLPEPH